MTLIRNQLNSFSSKMTKQQYRYTTVQLPERHIFVFSQLQRAPSNQLMSSNLWVTPEFSDVHATTQDSASKR